MFEPLAVGFEVGYKEMKFIIGLLAKNVFLHWIMFVDPSSASREGVPK